MWFPMLGLGLGLWAFWFLFRGVLGIVVVVFFIWLIARSAGSSSGLPRPFRSNGLDILEQRYARGEIPRDEYLQKKRDILAHDAP
jgi:putative membrane protein